MDRACGSYGEEEKSVRNLKGKDSCKDLGVDEIIILKWIIKK
jgi:phage gp16-like protein